MKNNRGTLKTSFNTAANELIKYINNMINTNIKEHYMAHIEQLYDI